jgi:hypothetical protein
MNLLKTFATIGPLSFHEVALTAQKLVTVEASKVSHVPGAALGFCTLVRENDLITSGTPWLEQLGMVTTAVDLSVRTTIEKVN